jgi:hypothetical protein
MRASEFTTDVGRKYQELYTQYYKRAHRYARQKGIADPDRFARAKLDQYKDKIQKGEWDPITRRKGTGRAEYK